MEVEPVISGLSADNDNRPKLDPIPGNRDCQHDYINASFIDVSLILPLSETHTWERREEWWMRG